MSAQPVEGVWGVDRRASGPGPTVGWVSPDDDIDIKPSKDELDLRRVESNSELLDGVDLSL